LDIRAVESIRKGGTRGPALVPGNASASLIYRAVSGAGPVRMPPGAALPQAEVDAIRAWIDAGAKPGADGAWWSFQPVRRPQAAGIDALVDAQLAQRGLRPAGRADKRALIRRAYFDLHGLPPPAAEIERFQADASPDAWAKLVDRLLESPRYGERWGRHWLDVVRYADTGGFETDIYFPNAWRYRDYVIKSFNDDKAFDRFIQEQVAGDELWPGTLDLEGSFDIPEEKRRRLEARIGTGMYTIGPVYHEAALFEGQVRYEWLTDAVDTTGEAFLGLTLGCARCHNHKFDPLTQRDYHAMMAVFATSDEREVPVISRFNTFGFKSGFPAWLKVEEIKAAIGRIDSAARKRVVDKVRARFPEEVLKAHAVPSQKRTPEQRALAARIEGALTEAGLEENAQGKKADIPYTPEESARKEALIGELGQAALRANPVAQTATVLGRAEVEHEVHIAHRGDWRSKGDRVGPGFPEALARGTAVADPNRRSELARWLTDPAHPLTARVIANRVWHWHFGRGIVATPGDFGRQGEAPTHPELLHWLAAELVSGGWSLKRLHRAIMASEAYMRSSAFDADNARVDADNRYLWRMNRRRLDAEALRDSVLAASGSLNLKMGGRPAIPPLSKEEYSALWSRNQWPESMDPAEHDRRSVYLYVKRTFPLPMLSAFDAPDTSVSCSRRDSTTVAPQALTMMNGEFMARQASRLAEAAKVDADPVAAVWRRALGRLPRDDERTRVRGIFLSQLALVLLNTNEFLYVD
jgi:hypothetical protein